MSLYDVIDLVRSILWNGPLLVAIFAVGLIQTWRLGFIQIRYLPKSLGMILHGGKSSDVVKTKKKLIGDISAFQSLMTALAGSIGTGNIAGIATAITAGGYGAIFWMWIVAFFGMATAYSEVLLSVKYRTVNEEGHASGGPMYTLLNGLNFKGWAKFFAFAGALASLITGCMIQSHSVADAVTTVFNIPNYVSGLVMATLTGFVILGGIGKIGKVAGILVPFMAVAYLLCGGFILVANWSMLPSAFMVIFESAFNGQAAFGGFLGASATAAIQMGFSKGIFSNEAGLGSLAIAAASAKTSNPAKQGLLAMGGVFISTMLVCTMTGLVLGVSQLLGVTSNDGTIISGASLAIMAFAKQWSGFSYVVVLSLIMFAFTTVLAWAYYGEKCAEYLLGNRFAHQYRFIYTFMVFVGSLLHLGFVWALADIANALMVIPNLISILMLTKVTEKETQLFNKEVELHKIPT